MSWEDKEKRPMRRETETKTVGELEDKEAEQEGRLGNMWREGEHEEVKTEESERRGKNVEGEQEAEEGDKEQ